MPAMSCLFCDSNLHLSENCDTHVTDELKKEILRFKKRCEYCLTQLQESQEDLLSTNKNYNGCDECNNRFSHTTKCSRRNMVLKTAISGTFKECSEKCCHFCLNSIDKKHKRFWNSTKNRQKCFKCFSINHHTVFCSKRDIDPNIFQPNIDADLHSRFFLLFNFQEQYAMALASPEISWETAKLQPLQIKNNLDVNCGWFNACSNFTLGFSGTFNVRSSFYATLNFNQIICKASKIVLCDLTIPPQNLFLLLSSYTEIINLTKITFFAGVIDLCEILQKIPNVEEIQIIETSITTNSDTWLDECLNNRNLKVLSIPIEYKDLNIEKLINLMNRTPINISFYMQFAMTRELVNNPKGGYVEIRNQLKSFFSQNFDESQNFYSNLAGLHILTPKFFNTKHYETIGYYCLKSAERDEKKVEMKKKTGIFSFFKKHF